jgi:hypothetical protein
MRTYILERTQGFFTRLPDKPCSGAARFEPANSGGCSASVRHLNDGNTLPPARLGADPPASAMAGVGHWPPPVTWDT